ncbi:hypothetical protein A3G67_03720 [Candidatus Roizmanbacteria bacterium RIFCSPLOWO2_12_FULL_40_12]|uniref:Mannosyl-glycoprotein endo-beta-N-acetylglucosamidase-like domain-containing protein n=1 Tax=Candidatus Roizmanbacteria bacterium RIFCSPLOWO2_01_FULL_40_42 TaxID=1802066 RepID=A0A1F7J5Q5_9BACT|nr:MAG: hypothetical protein A2779_03355 [Candidatus Roizmanbacteria bacterium RIFCSPHIGHO2_01_FULL_40_98]OGK28375.1 MAG: hypothetical protein A3C31_00720 [Candidatus Roizmanbacteria bacterium RIFCSPHIGHO2_02_FULL_40_53]OGK30611.1 MAG: hypothetical protein A2W49_03405 [Candidatus Roizmanbacteria bacterium RIFCSPHIGHO2_12_41_18]OGK37025.1 MAG: hypothetical protein A3E69_00980 [Candidatus Roizmanbacteria bacterium RIFCSPHIGHO2_12_FULL_40_130]OGK50931.1 MAG: hypothetical protein A3B50_01490 [Candi
MQKKKFLWLVAFLILFILNVYTVTSYVHKVRRVEAANLILEEISQYQEFSDSAQMQKKGYQADVQLSDGRAANLKLFFRKYNSPLYDHADFIVKTADKYQFDYRLLPAIAMIESGLCRAIPTNSHNCWGWGIYGNTVTRFESYEEAIETVSKGLRKNYLDKGMTTASQIMASYAPSSTSWANNVNNFLNVLE